MKTTVVQAAIPVPVSKECALPSFNVGAKRLLTNLFIILGLVCSYPVATAATATALSYNLKTVMVGTGLDNNARGNAFFMLIRNEDGDSQRLRIQVAGLARNTTYQLRALLGDDAGTTAIADFTTDRRGMHVIVYSKNRQGRAPRGMRLLTAALDPICNVRELEIVNGDGQAVLRAFPPVASRRAYLVSRRLQNSGLIFSAAGTLAIKATPGTAKFRFLASGLNPSTAYILFANEGAGQTITSDSAGRLSLGDLPQGFSNPLDIRTLSLSDTNGNLVLSTVGMGIPCGHPPAPHAPQASVNLGGASAFAVLAGSTVTSSGLTVINNGDLGVSPGTAVEGFPPATITNGGIHLLDPAVANAQLNLTTAYNDAAGRTVGPVAVSGNLGGRTLPPGLYKSTSSLEISSGDLTLDAQGDANAVFIFQIASTLATSSDRKVFLTGNARAANIFWQVGTSATLGTTSVFKGTIMADQSITLMTGAVLEGRALARIAAVTLDASRVTAPAP